MPYCILRRVKSAGCDAARQESYIPANERLRIVVYALSVFWGQTGEMFAELSLERAFLLCLRIPDWNSCLYSENKSNFFEREGGREIFTS